MITTSRGDDLYLEKEMDVWEESLKETGCIRRVTVVHHAVKTTALRGRTGGGLLKRVDAALDT